MDKDKDQRKDGEGHEPREGWRGTKTERRMEKDKDQVKVRMEINKCQGKDGEGQGLRERWRGTRNRGRLRKGRMQRDNDQEKGG